MGGEHLKVFQESVPLYLDLCVCFTVLLRVVSSEIKNVTRNRFTGLYKESRSIGKECCVGKSSS